MVKKRGRKPKPKDDKDQQQQSAGKMKEAKKIQQPSVDEKYTQWKSLVPVLYDWLANHNLVWPSLSCRYFFVFLCSSSSFSRVFEFLVIFFFNIHSLFIALKMSLYCVCDFLLKLYSASFQYYGMIW